MIGSVRLVRCLALTEFVQYHHNHCASIYCSFIRRAKRRNTKTKQLHGAFCFYGLLMKSYCGSLPYGCVNKITFISCFGVVHLLSHMCGNGLNARERHVQRQNEWDGKNVANKMVLQIVCHNTFFLLLCRSFTFARSLCVSAFSVETFIHFH